MKAEVLRHIDAVNTPSAREQGQGPGRLRIEREGPIARLVIDNPGRRNALSRHMWQSFAPALAGLERDPDIKVLIVQGAGGTFSAGADIREVEAILRGDSETSEGGDLTVAEEALAGFRKPTIAAIDGHCVGGGWELAGACDLRVATEDAMIGITPARLGIVYPFSGIARLVRLVGPATAKRLLLTGDLITAPEAQRAGLLSATVPRATLRHEVDGLAHRLADGSQFSAWAHKSLIDEIAAGSHGLAELSSYWQREMAHSPDAAIGVSAFLAKERPAFAWRGPWSSAAQI
ncbi:enoyl-CoA hydratase/isomerase family protein [Sinomonas sp. ASV486]|uniref:enoyl-CoA hydratase/isomerase family protein n=1 Tax=Sinomonas sp. ASV486 TaxID=3051170 RepID=UPI0027DB154E|nr:enoyl-CoA hydratase/isomerase family protein [Sinomonas sp. ASV486]MDQ4490674.1 enoyl-CoA hydratase/isomerase family protein [Sinomonas sp. ASV486]